MYKLRRTATGRGQSNGAGCGHHGKENRPDDKRADKHLKPGKKFSIWESQDERPAAAKPAVRRSRRIAEKRIRTNIAPGVRNKGKTEKGISQELTHPPAKKQAELCSLVEEIQNMSFEDGSTPDPMLMSGYDGEILTYLREHEIKCCPPRTDQSPSISPRNRHVLVDWLIDVQCFFSLKQETLYLTVSLVDSFLRRRVVSIKELQLLGVTCLLLACKYEEMYIPEIQDLCDLTANTYTKHQVLEMEQQILHVLQGDLFYPTDVAFLSLYLVRGGLLEDEELRHTCDYLLDLGLTDDTFRCHRPSRRAAAALCLALKVLRHHRLLPRDDKDDNIWMEKLAPCTTYSEMELDDGMRRLAKLAEDIPSSKLQAVQTKYNCSSKMFISYRATMWTEARSS